jgi:hypothetical protein
MKLFNFSKKEDDIEHIAAILLRQDEGVGYVCKVNNTKKEIELIDERAFKYSHSWESLVYDIDELLFSFENIHALQIKKATFFVYSHLVDSVTGNLKEPYMQSLKDVVKENNLESLGYIEMEESLARTYSNLEQSPLNAVMMEVDSAAVSVFVYKGGRKSFGNTIAKTENIVEDLEELFKRTDKGSLLPARILMYDSPTVESESHRILTHTWSDNLFIHLPRVDVVRDVEIKQAIQQGVTQELFGDSTRFTAMSGGESASMTDDVEPEVPVTIGASVKPQEEVMGFVIDGDVQDTYSPSAAEIEEAEVYDTSMPEETEYEPVETAQGALSGKIKAMFASISFPKFAGGNSRQRLIRISAWITLLATLVGVVVAVLFFFHKASLTVLYKSDPIEETLSFGDDVKFTEYKETFKVSAQRVTTGKEDIGEKATGEVTIYNADDEDKDFPKGTKLTTADGLVFVTDKEVTVDAAKKTITDEGDVLATTSKASVGATAQELGTKHNIKKDVKMSIAGFSNTTYFAKSAEAFTGGSSEEVQTVSRADYAAIDKKIEVELAKKSKEKLKTISSKGNIVDDLTLIDKKDQTYSKEISEEATSLESEVSAHVSFYAYDDKQIKKAIQAEIQDQVPATYLLKEADITYTIASAKRDDESGDISIEIDAVARPELKLDLARVKSVVKGSSLDSLRKTLEAEFKAGGFEAEVQTPLPFLRSRLPWFSQNITVDLRPLSK